MIVAANSCCVLTAERVECMNLEQIDGHCDAFERRLRKGERLTAQAFVDEQQLPSDRQLLDELGKLEWEYAEPHPLEGVAATVTPEAAVEPTRSMPSSGSPTSIGNYRLLQQIGECLTRRGRRCRRSPDPEFHHGWKGRA